MCVSVCACGLCVVVALKLLATHKHILLTTNLDLLHCWSLINIWHLQSPCAALADDCQFVGDVQGEDSRPVA